MRPVTAVYGRGDGACYSRPARFLVCVATKHGPSWGGPPRHPRHFAEFWETAGWPALPVTGHYTTANMLSDALTAGTSPRLSGNYILYVDRGLNVFGLTNYATDQFIQAKRADSPVITLIGGTGSVTPAVQTRLNFIVGN